MRNKPLKDWPQAKVWLYRSISHNRAAQGDSAAVLAYSYFHLAGVHHAQSQPDSTCFYAHKSLILSEHHELADLREELRALLDKMN